MTCQDFMNRLRFQQLHVQQEKNAFLRRLRRDTSCCSPQTDRKIGVTGFGELAIFVFFELLFSIRYLVFSSASGTLVQINDNFLFHNM